MAHAADVAYFRGILAGFRRVEGVLPPPSAGSRHTIGAQPPIIFLTHVCVPCSNDDLGTPRAIPKWVLDDLGLDDGVVRRRNHWVPVTYLRHFAKDGKRKGLMWLYDREDPHDPQPVTPQKIVSRICSPTIPLSTHPILRP